MTTMRHRFDKENKDKNKEETPEERAARIERLLDASAGWEPEKPEPDDLVARAVARIERERSASWWSGIRYARAWWGLSTLGAAVAAAAVFVIGPWNSGPEQTVLYIPRSSDAPRIWQVDQSVIAGDEESPRYRTVALMPEGFARPVMSMPTMSPSGYTARLASPQEDLMDTAFEEALEPKKTVLASRKPALVAANRAGSVKKERSPFTRKRHVPTVVSGTRGKEVEELDMSPVWQEETVTRQDYRVAVPVMLTPNDADSGNPDGIPAVVEMTFEPPTVPLRSTFEE